MSDKQALAHKFRRLADANTSVASQWEKQIQFNHDARSYATKYHSRADAFREAADIIDEKLVE